MRRCVTKKQKRTKHSVISRVIRIARHFFPHFNEMLKKTVSDKRYQPFIVYKPTTLIDEDIIRNMSGVATMRSADTSFNEKPAIKTLGRLSGQKNLKTRPCYTTLNSFFEIIDPKQLEKMLPMLINILIRTKQFEKYTVGGYYPVILDGTGYAFFRKKHCEHDLVMTITDKKTGEKIKLYYHKVVIAKIVLAPKLILTLGVEFIENENENVSKQDCENRAAKRLMERIKKEFPRLPILIQGDALYGVEPIAKQCIGYHWKYLFNLKPGTQPTISSDFAECMENGDKVETKNGLLRHEKENGTATFMNGVETISGKDFPCNCLHYEYTVKSGKDAGKTNTFEWLTNITVTKDNVQSLVRAGRARWKIENEGFNVQKNSIYKIEHHCSLNGNAMKVHFLITQIADLFMQLFMVYDAEVFNSHMSLKDTASKLLISFVRDVCTASDESFINKATALHMKT